MTEKPEYPKGAVVVTGTSSGIGRACALHLDKLGFRVFAGVRREKDGESLRNESAERITPLVMDVTDEASVIDAAGRAAHALEDAGLSGLVNNAGIVVSGPLEFLPITEIRKQLEVNVIGQIAVTQAFLPLIRKARGRIVNMGSIAGRMALPFLGPYSASKYALEAMTDCLRLELLQWGITVSIIEPGPVKTPIWEKTRETAGKTARNYPAQAFELYGPALSAFGAAAEKAAQGGVLPEAVVRAVEHALTARKPKIRYVVGRRALLQAFLKRILPDRMFDKLIVKKRGLPNNGLGHG